MADETTPQPETENEGLKNLLTRHNSDWAALAAELYAQTGRLRDDKRDLNTRIVELEGQKPKDGQRVLTKAEADRYDAFMGLGGDGVRGDPAKLKGALEAGVTAQKTAHAATVREGLRQLGYEPTDRLLRDFEGVSLTVADGDKGVKVGTVKVGDETQDFSAWAKTAGLESDLERYRTQPPGVPVLAQVVGGRAGPVTTQQRQEEKQQTGDYSL